MSSAKLISISKPVGELNHLTPEQLIAYCARVSSPKNQDKHDTAVNLIRYCIKNKHWSIFEQVSMGVEITTTRAISPQILRHRSFSFQEFSQRYAEAQSFINCPARSQDAKNRQNSNDDLSEEAKRWFNEAQNIVSGIANEMYKTAISKGVAKECARFLLPLNTETKLYMHGTIRSFLHYVEVRTDTSTQKEHRDIAEAIKQILKVELPTVAEAMGW